MVWEMAVSLTLSYSNKPAQMEGFPMKEWTVEIYILDQDGKEKPARCFTKAVYHLHPSFDNPVQSMSSGPLAMEKTAANYCSSFRRTPFQVYQRRMGRVRDDDRPVHDREGRKVEHSA